MVRRIAALLVSVALPVACQTVRDPPPPEADPVAVAPPVEAPAVPVESGAPDEPSLNEWGGEVPLSQPAGEVREERLEDVL